MDQLEPRGPIDVWSSARRHTDSLPPHPLAVSWFAREIQPNQSQPTESHARRQRRTHIRLHCCRRPVCTYNQDVNAQPCTMRMPPVFGSGSASPFAVNQFSVALMIDERVKAFARCWARMCGCVCLTSLSSCSPALSVCLARFGRASRPDPPGGLSSDADSCADH